MKAGSSVILITGASSGIGAALATDYAATGITLLLVARNAARLEEVASACRRKGAQVEIASIDVRDKAAMAEFIQRMDDQFLIDLVIANAGISTGSFSGSETLEAAEAVFDINVNGVINSIHPIIPRMIARKRGHIAIMSSLAGIRALPGAPAYSASKAAVRYYGDALRGHLKQYAINVTVICPGWIVTPLTARNDFPMPLLMTVERASRLIRQGISEKKSRVAFPKTLYVPLVILAALPNFLTDFIFSSLPAKSHKS